MEKHQVTFIDRLFSRFNYPAKFLLISLFFLFSILISNFFMFRAESYRLKFSSLELEGIRYQSTLKNLLELIIKHQLLSQRYISGNVNLRGQLLEIQTEINSNFKLLGSIDTVFEKKFGIDHLSANSLDGGLNNLNDVQLRWEELSRQNFDLPPEISAALHDQVLFGVKDLLDSVNDFSNLVLDPDLKTNYLMEMAFQLIPETEIYLSQLLVESEKIVRNKTKSQDELTLITGLKALLDRNMKALGVAVKKSKLQSEKDSSPLDSIGNFKDLVDSFTAKQNDLITYINENIIEPDQIKAKTADLISVGSKAVNDGFYLMDETSSELESLLKKRVNDFRMQAIIGGAISLLCALTGFVIGYIVMRAISRPLLNMVSAAKHLAGGDLSIRIPVEVNDEVGQAGIAFNQMVESLNELIGRLQWTGIQLTTSTTQIAAAAKEQESTVVQQEATTKQIAVTAKEISATAKDFAKTMNEISSTAEQTSTLAAHVKAGLTRMEAVMRQMVDASGNIAAKLAVLNEKASNITTVVTTISKVADQTNLLSLNAAIAAEKAGEQGKSFAVIAREIRRLADQTANATLDIEKMVNEIVTAVSAGVMGVDKFSEEIHAGVTQVSTVSDQLNVIIGQVQQLTGSFETVNEGMQTQSIGAEQINDSIGQLIDAAQQTTESIRQFHNAIDQLNNAAQEMQNAVSKIKR